MAWKPILPRHGFWLVCAALVLAGCQEQEQIREYTVAKDPPMRLLAVMAPRDESTWFFKLMGPAAEVEKRVQAFDAFVASVRFSKGGEIEWKVPEDWSEEHTDKRFKAVIRFAGKGMPLPITITQLGGPQARDVRANLNRWRVEQLGLDAISDAELKKLEDNIQVGGRKATRVDFVGPGGGKGARRVETAAPAEPSRRPFTFVKPDDWEELPADAVSGIRRDAVFRVGPGEHTAQTTIMRFGGAGGGALANINRWRNELGLAPLKEDELRPELRSLNTASGRADYVELTGRDRKNEERATLGAWIAHGGQTWFITMKGPADLVRAQKSAFEAFVQSFRLQGGAGAAHE
jgi:hypothetical protein